MQTQNTALGTLHDSGQFYSHFVATTQNHNKKAREIIGCKRTAFQMAERAFCAVLLYMGNKPNCLMRRGQATLLGRSMPTLSIIGLQFPTKMASWSARFLKHYVTTSLRKYTEITYSTNVWLCDMIARHLDLDLRYYCDFYTNQNCSVGKNIGKFLWLSCCHPL